MADAVVRMQAIIVDGADLVVHIVIECEKCGGEHDLIFNGHHAPPIVELLTELIEQEPQLTHGGHVESVSRKTFEIRPREN